MKILLVRLSSLGDIFHAYALPAYIKHHIPTAHITWLCDKRFASMLEALPHVDRVIGVPLAKLKQKRQKKGGLKEALGQLKHLRQTHFDYAFDFQSNLKSGSLMSLAKAKQKVGFTFATAREWPASLCLNKRIKRDFSLHKTEQLIHLVSEGLKLDRAQVESPPFALNEEEQQLIKTFKQKLNPARHKVMVAIGASRENKKLAIGAWIELLNELANLAPIDFFCVWGLPHEKQELELIEKSSRASLHLLDKMSIPVWQAHMQLMDGVIGLDSSALHLAQVSGMPTFAFFGPTKADQLNLNKGKHQFYQGLCPYKIRFDDNERCPYQKVCLTGACLKKGKLTACHRALKAWLQAHVLRSLSKY